MTEDTTTTRVSNSVRRFYDTHQGHGWTEVPEEDLQFPSASIREHYIEFQCVCRPGMHYTVLRSAYQSYLSEPTPTAEPTSEPTSVT